MNFVNRKLRFQIRRQYTVGQKIWICPGKKIVKLWSLFSLDMYFQYFLIHSKILNFIENIQKYFSWNWFSISIQFLQVLFHLNFLKFLAGCALQNFQKSSKMAETKGVCDRSSINEKKNRHSSSFNWGDETISSLFLVYCPNRVNSFCLALNEKWSQVRYVVDVVVFYCLYTFPIPTLAKQ